MAELKDRYATALFELSQESGELESHIAQVALLREELEKDQLTELLENPHIPDATKRELLERLFGDRLSKDLLGFLFLTIERGRESMILPTLDAYLDLSNQRRGKAMAYLVSAQALRPEQTEAIGTLLSRKLGKKTEILARVDTSLIGGFYIQVEGRMIDRTVCAQLNHLKENLKRGGPNDRKT